MTNEAPISQKELPKLEPNIEETVPRNPLPAENPLFSNNIPVVESEIPIEEENSFWFPSDTPDALNELPDLNVSSNNFFVNTTMPDLNFPDLKVDFGTNDSEEK